MGRETGVKSRDAAMHEDRHRRGKLALSVPGYPTSIIPSDTLVLGT